MGFHYN
jgi:hypothetical protein